MKDILITEDMVIEQKIAFRIHWWIENNKERMYQYCNGIDRCCDITFVIREAVKEAREQIQKFKEEGRELPYLLKGNRHSQPEVASSGNETTPAI
jgi:hypothetical protein